MLLEFEKEWMEAVLIALNDEFLPRRTEMRRLVETWQRFRRNIKKFLAVVPELRPFLYDGLGRPRSRASLIPRGTGFDVMVMVEAPGDIRNPKDLHTEMFVDEARLMFLRLLLLPEVLRGKLSEEPCDKCHRYYLKKTIRQKKYCSDECRKSSAWTSMEKKRGREHEQKVHRARELLGECPKSRLADWKRWICEQDDSFKATFLTRAVNRGELKEPHQERK